MKTATQIKNERIAREIEEREETIRKSLRRLRSRVIECEDDVMLDRLHKEIDRKKEELMKLTQKYVDKFTIKFTKRKEYNDYFVSAKYKYSELQACITKDDYDKIYWSSDVVGNYRYLKDIKEILTEQMKRELGAI